MPRLNDLPDELLENIVLYLSPRDTVAFGATCKRCDKITHEALVWRRHCIETWRYWAPSHGFTERLEVPPAQTRWRDLFNNRRKADADVLAKFNTMLLTQQHRLKTIEELTASGEDVLDLMLEQEDVPDDAEDVLARRWHARVIRQKLYREIAIQQWIKISDSRMISLDSALGAYDLFALSGRAGGLEELNNELQRHASAILERTPSFEDLSTRQKAIEIAIYLRLQDLLGNDEQQDYHALRNNYISLALFGDSHSSLPLQSAAIYCGVARRLGVAASPSNYPHHVYVVVQPPRGFDLDGRHKTPSTTEIEHDYMYMDPWRSSEEVDRSTLIQTLRQMGTDPTTHDEFLGPASTAETVIRASRNIINSVTDARNRIRIAASTTSRPDDIVDIEKAWYSTLWATMLVGYGGRQVMLQRRRSCLPYIMKHFQVHFQEDLGLLERYIVPMFINTEEHATLLEIVEYSRAGDENKMAPSPRAAHTAHVEFKVGHHFKHGRYGYTGVVIGWDATCEAHDEWITEMRVDELPRGRDQPFYHVLAADKSIRYVAQENITLIHTAPSKELLHEAGRYFKRFDSEGGFFVSNIKEKYPDD